MINKKVLCASLATLLAVLSAVWAVDVKGFRLLSIAETNKLILISEIPQKTKYVLDATPAKITVDGKPAEFKDLKSFTLIRVKFEARKGTKDGIEIDGVATEIIISTPENTSRDLKAPDKPGSLR